MTISSNINSLLSVQKAIKLALKSKNVKPGKGMISYPDDIRRIQVSNDVPIIRDGTKFAWSLSPSFPAMNTSNMTDMSDMFAMCERMEYAPELDTSNVTDMEDMFYHCTRLRSIPYMDTSNVTNMRGMVSYCRNITHFPTLDTSKVTNFEYTWSYCHSLRSLPLLDFSSAETIGQLTFYAQSLVDFGGFKGLKKSIYLGYTSISEESFRNIIEQADTLTTWQTFYLGDNINKMSEETIAMATRKKWSVSSSKF